MTQQEYEEILDAYVYKELKGGIKAFEDNYLETLIQVRDYMGTILRNYYNGDLKKIKNVSGKNGENTKRLNCWLEKNGLIPTTFSK